MTHGTIAGILITDLITGNPNAWEELYDPSRKKLRTAGSFISEIEKSAVQYIGDLLHREYASPAQTPPGSPAVASRKSIRYRSCESTLVSIRPQCDTGHRQKDHPGELLRPANGNAGCPLLEVGT